MALKKSFEVTSGLVAQDAYVRVQNVSIVHGEQAGATIHVYVNDQAKEPVKVLCYGFQHSHNNGSAVAQAYNHIKTLPEFAGAVDC
jgi:hypothetical protein